MSKPKGQLARPIFAKIAPHEFLVANLVHPSLGDAGASLGTRPNGRTPDEARPFEIHAGSLSQAHGSAAVRLGSTRVVCGVRGEILPVTNIPHYRPSTVSSVDSTASPAASAADVEADNRRQLRSYDLLVPNLELATGSAPEFLPGGPPSVLAQVLSTRLYALLHGSGLVDAEALKIWHRPEKKEDTGAMDIDEEENDAEGEEEEEDQQPELKAYWTLYVDLLFLSFDGNPLDAAWAAVVAALRDTRLPRARWDADRDRVVCAPPSTVPASSPLLLRGLPVAATVVVCVENKKKHQQRQGAAAAGAHWVLQDPDRLEESQCRETVTVVVDCSAGKKKKTVVRALSKSGGVLVGPDEMHTLVAAAEKRWAALAKALPQER